jgi:hypothetical protein
MHSKLVYGVALHALGCLEVVWVRVGRVGPSDKLRQSQDKLRWSFGHSVDKLCQNSYIPNPAWRSPECSRGFWPTRTCKAMMLGLCPSCEVVHALRGSRWLLEL